MRTWWRVATVGLLVVPVGGCEAAGRSSEPVTPVATTPTARAAVVPKAGTCHRNVEAVSYPITYAPTACTATHLAETVSVQTFPDAPATLPTAGSPPLRKAFDVCDTEVRGFVGADWRGGSMSVQVVTPSADDWARGSRWFRCDVFQIAPLDIGTSIRRPNDHPMERLSSLAGALRSTSALSYDCFNEDEFENLLSVACTRPHRFEYSGVWTTSYPSLAVVKQKEQQVHDRCREVMVARASARDRGVVREAGTTFRPPSAGAWARGDRGIRCFVWLDDGPRSRSVIADPTGTITA